MARPVPTMAVPITIPASRATIRSRFLALIIPALACQPEAGPGVFTWYLMTALYRWMLDVVDVVNVNP